MCSGEIDVLCCNVSRGFPGTLVILVVDITAVNGRATSAGPYKKRSTSLGGPQT